MSQRFANYEADCTDCYRYIAQDDPIWINEDGKFCTNCAVKRGIDCPKCHGSKRPNFDLCYDCNRKKTTNKAMIHDRS